MLCLWQSVGDAVDVLPSSSRPRADTSNTHTQVGASPPPGGHAGVEPLVPDCSSGGVSDGFDATARQLADDCCRTKGASMSTPLSSAECCVVTKRPGMRHPACTCCCKEQEPAILVTASGSPPVPLATRPPHAGREGVRAMPDDELGSPSKNPCIRTDAHQKQWTDGDPCCQTGRSPSGRNEPRTRRRPWNVGDSHNRASPKASFQALGSPSNLPAEAGVSRAWHSSQHRTASDSTALPYRRRYGQRTRLDEQPSAREESRPLQPGDSACRSVEKC